MDNNQDSPKEKLRVVVSTEHKEGTITVKGVVENESDDVVCLEELTALYKNFDGFVVDVDRMAYKFDLPSGDKFPFRFPERHAPINCYTYEVVVSKSQVKQF
ncbi:MAG: hypothetical protein JRJ69_18215 [Deltaproteobacteria bacterium]|nr:hypothetical protein [Deltaproteobacteria bacterium]MBW2033631.1 hypothetical protein [Deltaproteobacteria bacterium]